MLKIILRYESQSSERDGEAEINITKFRFRLVFLSKYLDMKYKNVKEKNVKIKHNNQKNLRDLQVQQSLEKNVHFFPLDLRMKLIFNAALKTTFGGCFFRQTCEERVCLRADERSSRLA